MTGLWREDDFGSAALDPQGLEGVPASTGEALGAAFGQGLADNYGTRSAQWLRDQVSPMLPDSPMLSPDEANQQYGIPGVLSWDKPVSERVAADLHEARHEAQLRADIVQRGPQGLLMKGASLVAGFGAGMLDPVNVAAAFIPVVGEARVAAWLADAGTTLGRAGVRAGVGAIEGATGMAALQPLDYALSRYNDEDYTMGTALRNIAFGGLLGGVLHPLGGYVGDALRAGPRNPAALQSLDAGHDAREAALSAGVAQHVQGDPVNVAPLLDTAALRSSFADRNAARGDTGLGNYAAYTPDGMRVELQPQVAELSSLVASHAPDGTVNPAYPHAEGMQPRDRTNAASQAQITELASRLEPERLQPSPEASTGAPIVNQQGVVESGNGRVMALSKVYGDPALADQAAAYRAMLEARGHDVSGMKAPVLIGRRISALNPAEATRFARGANERATLGMNAAEQARADASRAGRASRAWQPGSITGPANQRFVSEFMAQIPAEERAAMLGSDGRLSAAGAGRINGALLGHAYGDALGPTLERMLNGDTEHMKGIAGALSDVAGAWGRMREAAARGEIPAGLDITPAIGEAVQLLDRARASGTPIAELLAQGDMMGGPSPAAVALLRLMFNDDAMRRPAGRAKLAELLARYTEQAEQARTGPGLFGQPETGPGDILRALAGTDQRIADAADSLLDLARPGGNARPEEVAASKSAQDVARKATSDHVGDGAEATAAGTAEPLEEATGGRMAVPDRGDLYQLNHEELYSLREQLKLDESMSLENALGPADAKRWRQLERASNSMDTRAADRAIAEQLEWEERLTPEQQRLIYGIGETGPTAEEVAAVLDAHQDFGLPDNNVAEVLRATSHGLTGVNPREVVAVPQGGGSITAQVAFVKLYRGYEELQQLGLSREQIGPELVNAMIRRGMEPNDANWMMEQFTKAAEEPNTARTTAAATRALPAPNKQLAAPERPAEAGPTPEAARAAPMVMSPELQEAQRLADQAVAAVRTEIAAGRLSEPDLAELRAADQGVQQAQGDAAAIQQAAACLFGKGLA